MISTNQLKNVNLRALTKYKGIHAAKILASRFRGHDIEQSRHHGSLSTSGSADELKHFSDLADSWWDVKGPQRILHKMNLLRVEFIIDTLKKYSKPVEGAHIQPVPGFSLDLLPADVKLQMKQREQSNTQTIFKDYNLDVLDIGCGGGILSESLARLDITHKVRGIDLSTDVIGVAEKHMKRDPKLQDKLDYRLIELEKLGPEETYDIVTMFEVLEHVPYPSQVLSKALEKVRPGGWVFLSTINRTPVSYFTTIFVGEYLLKIVPKGTHTWSKYINESELREWFNKQSGWEVASSNGCVYVPALGWKMTGNAGMGNYFMAARRIK